MPVEATIQAPHSASLNDDLDVLFNQLSTWAKRHGVGLLLGVEEPQAAGDIYLLAHATEEHELLQRIKQGLEHATADAGGTIQYIGGQH